MGMAETSATAVRLADQEITRRLGSGGGASRATTVEHDFVAIELEARRGEPCEVAGTAVHFEDLQAGSAVEVMVMTEVRALVTRGRARDLDQVRASVFDHGAERAVDGGEAKVWDADLRRFEDFGGSERSLGGCERVLDG